MAGQGTGEGAGVFYGWWVVAAGMVVLSAQGVMFYGFGIMFPAVIAEFHWSRALTSSVYSVQMSVNSLFILLMGWLIDRFSPRLIIGLGALCLGFGMAASSLTREIWHLYLFFGLVVGIGTSAMYVPPITVVTRWFEKRRGFALGLTVTGIGIGGFIGSPFFNGLIQAFGWRTALPILGLSLGAVVLGAALIMTGRPEDKGLRPYGLEGARPSAGPDLRAGSFEQAGSPAEEKSPNWTVREAIRTRPFILLFVMFFCAELALVGVMAHLFTYATENGLPNHLASWAYGLIGVTSLAGKIGMGALSDRIGRKTVFILAFGLKGTAFLLLLPQPSALTLFLFAALLGLSYGGWTPIFPAVLGDYFGLASMGRIFSILTINFLLGGVCGPVLAGWIFDRQGSYWTAFAIFSAASYLSMLLAVFLSPPNRPLDGRVRV
ncbi:MAG: MFS transporter [Proteobacteria bacterium]|nr:MFS transporter [Pseudomonadota bacterium]